MFFIVLKPSGISQLAVLIAIFQENICICAGKIEKFVVECNYA